MKLVYIHGTHATHNSFNHIREKLGARDEITIGYNSAHGFHANHARMLKGLFGEKQLLLIGHGLGGIHALHLAHALRGKVLGGITLSTPFGGCERTNPHAQDMWDIHSRSRVIEKTQEIPLAVPWTNLVSIGGNSVLLPQPNDGVVTRASMRYRRDMTSLEIDCNHFEILQHKETVATILHEIEMFELAMGLKQTENA